MVAVGTPLLLHRPVGVGPRYGGLDGPVCRRDGRERLYYVYEEPTYRDILELCLRPFAGQIFQSNGALHIRRAVSLYQTAHPVNFYRVGTEHPVGRIVTGCGLRLVIHTGAQVVTSAARERIDGMWTGDLHIEGSSTLDIVPALRKVSVDVKNKSLDNLIARIGFYDPDAWTDPHGFVSVKSGEELYFSGEDAYRGAEVVTRGFPVEQCNFPLVWEFGLQTYHREWGLGIYRPNESIDVAVHYGVRIVGEKATYSLTESGSWVQSSDGEIASTVKTGNEQNMKIEIDGIPCDGEWRFFIRQTLIGKITTYTDRFGNPSGRTSGYLESAAFRKMTLSIDAGDSYDKGLRYESLVDPANNVDMSVTLPVSDIPAIPTTGSSMRSTISIPAAIPRAYGIRKVGTTTTHWSAISCRVHCDTSSCRANASRAKSSRDSISI